MKIALVTGGAGFIGSHLVEELVNSGWGVRVLDDFSTGKSTNLARVFNEIDLFRGSILDHDLLAYAMKGVDVVFHLAAIGSSADTAESPCRIHHTCATGTLQVLLAAKAAAVKRFIYASTSDVYGNLPPSPTPEHAALNPESMHSVAKVTGERYCQLLNDDTFQTVILRYFQPYGPRQIYSGPVARFCALIAQGRFPILYGDGSQTNDFVHVTDVVRANLLAAEVPAAAGGIFNIGSGQQTSLLELAEAVGYVFKRNIEPHLRQPAESTDIYHSHADISLAHDVLGYQPRVGLTQGLLTLSSGTYPPRRVPNKNAILLDGALGQKNWLSHSS